MRDIYLAHGASYLCHDFMDFIVWIVCISSAVAAAFNISFRNSCFMEKKESLVT